MAAVRHAGRVIFYTAKPRSAGFGTGCQSDRMNSHRTVAIVLANWNGARFLDRAIASVANQSFEAWRLICVDTASTDDSRSILERWAARDRRIKLVFVPKRLNYPAGINVGLAHVDDDYVARIESE